MSEYISTPMVIATFKPLQQGDRLKTPAGEVEVTRPLTVDQVRELLPGCYTAVVRDVEPGTRVYWCEVRPPRTKPHRTGGGGDDHNPPQSNKVQ